MAHHGEYPPGFPFADLSKILNGEKLGATGNFPEGKLNEWDEGECKLAVGVEQGKVIVSFGTPVVWLGFTRSQAIELASSLIDHAAKCKV